MYTMNDLKLIQHNIPGCMPVFELQALSKMDKRWYAIHTENLLKKMENFCVKYSYPIPQIEECNNHK